MISAPDRPRDRSISDLAREAAWFLTHTLVAIVFLAAVLGVMTMNHPDPDSPGPKMVATALAFLVPMFGGLIVSRFQQNKTARYVWISGLVVFTVVSVWVLDLPTGVGLCQHCGSAEKIWRTFFSFSNGSGLMSGDGPLIGVWIPLAMVSYSVGAKFGLET